MYFSHKNKSFLIFYISKINLIPISFYIVPSSPTCASCKHEHAPSGTPPSSKRVRGSGAELQGLTASISQFSNNICKVLAGNPSERTPKHHAKAVKLAQQEMWLLIADWLILCNIFEKDIKAVDVYTALDDSDVESHEMWIQGKVDEVKAQGSAF